MNQKTYTIINIPSQIRRSAERCFKFHIFLQKLVKLLCPKTSTRFHTTYYCNTADVRNILKGIFNFGECESPARADVGLSVLWRFEARAAADCWKKYTWMRLWTMILISISWSRQMLLFCYRNIVVFPFKGSVMSYNALKDSLLWNVVKIYKFKTYFMFNQENYEQIKQYVKKIYS